MGFEDLDLSGLDEVQDIPHEFETDLHCVVVANHGFTMEAIEKAEDEGLKEISEGFGHEPHETIASMMNHEQYFFDDLRIAARSLALVALVTRFQYWAARFVKKLKITPKRAHHAALMNQLDALNEMLGVGPVPVNFFEELTTVRDSIIHGDSQAEWEFPEGKKRKIADRYGNAYGRVELTDEQLKEAIEKAILQVKWYDEKMQRASTPNP